MAAGLAQVRLPSLILPRLMMDLIGYLPSPPVHAKSRSHNPTMHDLRYSDF